MSIIARSTVRKTRMMWLPDGEKVWENVTDIRRTDGRTVTAQRHRPHLQSCNKNRSRLLRVDNGRPTESRIISIKRHHFQWPWTHATSLKSRYSLDAEYLRNGTRCRHSFNGILIGTYISPTQQCHFEWSWVTFSDLAKYSMTRSTRGLFATAELLVIMFFNGKRMHGIRPLDDLLGCCSLVLNVSLIPVQEAQLSQRDRARFVSLHIFAKSLKVTEGHSKWHCWEGRV